jgi:hypothetical protein
MSRHRTHTREQHADVARKLAVIRNGLEVKLAVEVFKNKPPAPINRPLAAPSAMSSNCAPAKLDRKLSLLRTALEDAEHERRPAEVTT